MTLSLARVAFEEDRCTRDDVELLFRVSDTKSARRLYIDFARALKRQLPAPDKPEYAFVHFWDSNIGNIMKISVPSGGYLYNSW